MPRDGSGNFNLVSGNPVVPNTIISSNGWANPTLSDLAAALTQSLSRDGQTTPTADLTMGNFKLRNLAAALARTDAVNAGQVQDGGLTTLASISGTDTITANSAPAITAYAAGQAFEFVAAGANTTAAVTLNINAIGAKQVLKMSASGLVQLSPGDLQNGQAVSVWYDGTQFQLISPFTPTAAIPFSSKVKNGNFDIWQRGTSFSNAANAVAAYTADCWQVFRNGFATGYTATQIAGPANSRFAIKIQRNSGDSSIAPITLGTSFETVDVTKWAGKTHNFSFMALGNGALNGASVVANVGFGTGTDGNATSGPSGSTSAVTQVFTLSSSYQRFSMLVAIPSNATQCIITLALTPNGTAGASDFMQYAQIAFTEGASILPFDRRDTTIELFLCQRYYQTLLEAAFYGYGSASGLMGYAIKFNPMRAAPSVTLPTIGYSNASNLQAPVVNVSSVLLYATVTALGAAAWDTNGNAIVLNSSL